MILFGNLLLKLGFFFGLVCLVKKRDLDGAQEAFSKAKAICASISHGEKSRFFRAVLGINEVTLFFVDSFC